MPTTTASTSIKVGLGFSASKDHIHAVHEAISKAQISFSPKEHIDLVIVFSSIEFAHITVLKTIQSLLGTIPTVGCSGMALCSADGIVPYGLAILLLRFPEQMYYSCAHMNEVNDTMLRETGKALGRKLLENAAQVQKRVLSIIFYDGLLKETGALIMGMQEEMGRSFPLVGAAATDNRVFKRTFVYENMGVLNNAVCGILLGGKLHYGLSTRHGWKPIGKPRLITKMEQNRIYEIDHKPAVQIYEEYLAKESPELKKDLNHISTFYPLGIYLPGENEYLLRNIAAIENDGALIVHGDIPKESTLRLMIGTKESCLQATKEAVDDVLDQCRGHTISLAFVFISASRLTLLGRHAAKELQIIRQGLGDTVPLVGIYTYSEQAPLKGLSSLGKTYLHNQTVTLLALGG